MGRLGGDDGVPGLQSLNDDQPLQAHPCPISPRSHRSGPHLNSFVGILCESGRYIVSQANINSPICYAIMQLAVQGHRNRCSRSGSYWTNTALMDTPKIASYGSAVTILSDHSVCSNLLPSIHKTFRPH